MQDPHSRKPIESFCRMMATGLAVSVPCHGPLIQKGLRVILHSPFPFPSQRRIFLSAMLDLLSLPPEIIEKISEKVG